MSRTAADHRWFSRHLWAQARSWQMARRARGRTAGGRRLLFAEVLEPRRLLSFGSVATVGAFESGPDIPAIAQQPVGGTYQLTVPSVSGGTAGRAPRGEGEAGELTIELGDHLLLPDQPNQPILVSVTGGLAVQGVEFNLQIADGGPEVGGLVDGPAVQDIDILTDAIFSGNHLGTPDDDGPHVDPYPQIEWRATPTQSGSVIAEGLLATVTIDTTGFFSGSWPLLVRDTLNGPTRLPFAPLSVVDGTISIAAGNIPPEATDDRAVTLRDAAVTIPVLADNGYGADFDRDGQLAAQSVVATAGAFGTTLVDTGTGQVTYTPQSGYTGWDQFTYTVTDDDGGVSAPATVSVEILPAGIELKEDGVLRLAGSQEDDWIQLQTSYDENDASQLIAHSDLWPSPQVFPMEDIRRIEVYAGSGDDRVFTAADVSIELEIQGGPGRDFLWGGAGGDEILGGEGDDRLWGRDGNDLLDGGKGDDRPWGEDGDDVLIGGPGLDHLWGGNGDNILDDDALWTSAAEARTDALLVDVDYSGFASPGDLLPIISYLNHHGTCVLIGDFSEQPELDVDGDGEIVPLDVLRAVNLLNLLAARAFGDSLQPSTPAGARGEGEGPDLEQTPDPVEAPVGVAFAPFAASSVGADSSDGTPRPIQGRIENVAGLTVSPQAAPSQNVLPQQPSPLEDEESDLVSLLAESRNGCRDECLFDHFFRQFGQ